ncbi:SDR family oxidoreductase [Amylibacter sp.]|nr:SDR family oxidoreductase [Amylibacter sp.]
MSKGAVLILGARSDIAMAVAHRFAKAGYDIQLAARNSESLGTDKSDIQLRYHVAVTLHDFDALDIGSHERFVDALPQLPSVAVCAVGFMGQQAENERDVQAAAQVMRSNFEGPASILGVLANRFEQHGSGTLVGISSVAGERGRATNYVYGSAKAGFTAFLSGLRNRLARQGVHVVTVLPGFVATQMTERMDLPARLTAQPSEVAEAIVRTVERKKDVIYVRPIWRVIMAIIRSIPERVFKGMKI